MWPVPGPSLEQSTGSFMSDKLRLDDAIVAELPNCTIRAVKSARSKITDEVVVTFPEIEMRDTVRAAASNLSGHRGSGLRLEIPDFLRPALRSLESVSYTLKRTHPSMKRNVKFDDENLDLVMDIKLSEEEPWRKIRPSQAKEAKKGQVVPSREGGSELNADDLQAMMQGSGSQGPATGANAQPQGSRQSSSGNQES